MILGDEALAKNLEAGVVDLQATRIVLGQRRIATNQVKRCSPLGALLGEQDRPVAEIERREPASSRQVDRLAALLRAPAKAAGDHQVNHDEQTVFELEHDPFADPPDTPDPLAGRLGEWWVDRAQYERASQADAFEKLAPDEALEPLAVDGNVGAARASWWAV